MRRLLGMALAMLATTASAADIRVAPFRGDQTITAITLSGEIVEHDDIKFQNAFWLAVGRSQNGVILELVSSGGDTFASEAISRFIHSQGIATLVRGDCTSGCGIIALSARSLWVAADGRVGLHQAWLKGKHGMAVGHMGATKEVAALGAHPHDDHRPLRHGVPHRR
jgi:ClpP class serine protease